MPASFYILASGRNGTLYDGSTNDLSKRVWEHKSKLTPGFTSRYGVTKLVLLQALRSADGCPRTRVQSETLAPCMEASVDRGNEPHLA
jgi:hypothetical protein